MISMFKHHRDSKRLQYIILKIKDLIRKIKQIDTKYDKFQHSNIKKK